MCIHTGNVHFKKQEISKWLILDGAEVLGLEREKGHSGTWSPVTLPRDPSLGPAVMCSFTVGSLESKRRSNGSGGDLGPF